MKAVFTKAAVAACALTLGSLAADTVQLKSGRMFTNVRANLGEKELEIETAEGIFYVFPAGELKQLQYGPFEKQKPIEKTDPQPTIQPETRSQAEESAAPCGYGTPVWESLLPIWSAHFCSGRTKLGIGFAAADAFLIYGFTQWANSTRTRNDDPVYFLTGLLLAERQTSEADKLPAFLIWNQIGKDLVYTPQGLVLDRKTWTKRRNGIVALLFISMALDAGSVYWFAAKPGSVAGTTAAPRPFLALIPASGRDEPTALAGFTLDL